MVVGTAPAFADFYEGGLDSAVFEVQPYNYNDTWQQPLNQSLETWNDSLTPANISKSEDADNTVTASAFPDTWYGLYDPPEWFSGFEISLNASTISEDADNFDNFVQSTFVHELGHALSMADNPDTSEESIMKYTRDRDNMTTPQLYDLREVNRFYTERG